MSLAQAKTPLRSEASRAQTMNAAGAGVRNSSFGLSAIGRLAAAIYGAGMLAAAADGFLGQRQPKTMTNVKEDRRALSAP